MATNIWYLANANTAPDRYPVWTLASASDYVELCFKAEDLMDYWTPLVEPDGGDAEIVTDKAPTATWRQRVRR